MESMEQLAKDLAAERISLVEAQRIILRQIAPRENVITKSHRLLTDGRLIVEKVDTGRGMVYATCRGDSGAVYQLGFDPRGQGEWRCSCPARTSCAHLKALQLVCVR